MSKNLILTTRPTPKPKPDSNQHLIRVHTFAPCAGELLWPRYFPPPDPSAKELVPCDDMAGTVVTAPSSSPFKVGDEVYARTNYVREGAGREYTIGETEELAHRPQNLNWVESAAVPLSSESAWQALFVHGGLGAVSGEGARGKRVLVTAASGGVGAWLVQLARWAGAEVVGTCGPDNVDFVRSLGATEVINYRATDLKEWAKDDEKKVDLVIDCVGGKSLEGAWWCVKDGGMIISICQPPEQVKPAGWAGKDVKNLFFIMSPNGPQLKEITKLVEEGTCKPVVDSVWAFEEYEEAFKRLDSGHARGKVVLDFKI